MKSITFALLLAITSFSFSGSDINGLQVGDLAPDFALKNVDGSMVSLADYKDNKGFILIFTCNHCPYAIGYEDRIIALNNKYESLGYPVVAINPNDQTQKPGDSFEGMQKKVKEKGFTFPYLHDETQAVARTYGATKTPHTYLLEKNADGKFVVRYIGAIDNDTEGNNSNRINYVEDAIASVNGGAQPDPDYTKAVGCTIKWKK